MKKAGLFILFLVFLIPAFAYVDDWGKIAVASEGQTTASMVSEMAARSPYFLIFDSGGNFLETMDNPYKTAGRKAGPSVVSFLTQKGVNFVVAGEFGDNMIQAMKGKGVKYLEFRGSTETALEKVLEVRK
jgi:predicted Fe-Mo cluster-binding NifX family protein